MTSPSFQTPPPSPTVASALSLAGRIGIAAIFVISGVTKVADPAGTIAYIQSSGLPLAQVGYGLAVLTELGGGLALILGFQTRLVAAILTLFTLVTALAFHTDLADQNQFINFFKNIAMAGGLLNVVVLGGGGWSLDARR